MSFDNQVYLSYGDEKVTTSTKRHRLGTRGVLPDGRVFYYARNGATELAPHLVVISKTVRSGTHAAAQTISTVISSGNTNPVGTTVGVIWATTPHTSGEYDDGYMTVETTPGEGVYKIASDPAAATSGVGSRIILEESDPLKVALTTVSKLAFEANPYSSVVVATTGAAPNNQTAGVAGVPNVTVPIRDYFWCQTWGHAAVRYDATTAAVVSGKVLLALTSPGVTGAFNSTTSGDTTAWKNRGNSPTIGWVYQQLIPDGGDNLGVFLTIRP